MVWMKMPGTVAARAASMSRARRGTISTAAETAAPVSVASEPCGLQKAFGRPAIMSAVCAGS